MRGYPTKKDRNGLREDLLRPSPYLGYGRDSLAMHLISCGAYDIAEDQLRRAIWLNPYEPIFKLHLAWLFYRQKRYVEARSWILEALAQEPNELKSQQLLKLIEKAASVDQLVEG